MDHCPWRKGGFRRETDLVSQGFSTVCANICFLNCHSPNIAYELLVSTHVIRKENNCVVQFIQLSLCPFSWLPFAVTSTPVCENLDFIFSLQLGQLCLCILSISIFHGSRSSLINDSVSESLQQTLREVKTNRQKEVL